MFKRKTQLEKNLDKNPGHIYVEDTFMAVKMPDGKILAIKGDFKSITAEEANLKLQSVLKQMQ